MTYFPLSGYRLTTSDKITGVALARSLQVHSELYLFTGGSAPVMVFLSGHYLGHGFEVSRGSPADMLAVEEIEFEVDPESLEIAALIERPVGALVMSDSGEAGIVSIRRDNMGFEDAIEVFFDDPSPTTRTDRGKIYFTRWKAFKRVGDEKHYVFEFEASKRD